MGFKSDVPSGIKSIQRGSINITASSSAFGCIATATISAVNMAKATLHLLGRMAGFNPSGINTPNTAGGYYPRIALTNATTVTVTRSDGNGELTVNFEVVEYY